jgi:hypothetical protein
VLEKYEEFGRQLRKRVRFGAVNPIDIDAIIAEQNQLLLEKMTEWREKRDQNLKEHPFVPRVMVATQSKVDKLATLLNTVTGLTVSASPEKNTKPSELTPKKKKDKKAESESEEEAEDDDAEEKAEDDEDEDV